MQRLKKPKKQIGGKHRKDILAEQKGAGDMIEAYGKMFDITEDVKNTIDGMGQYELACMLRFAPAGAPLMCGENGDYLLARFKALGGMTPGISKGIGW